VRSRIEPTSVSIVASSSADGGVRASARYHCR
jgi:hypothetical protein